MDAMSKDELVYTLQAERAGWDGLLKQLNDAHLDAVGVEGNWSVKDLLAHLTFYERRLVQRLEAAQRGAARPADAYDDLELDARNARIFDDNHNRPAADVLAESHTVFEQLIAAIEALDEATLNDPAATEGIVGSDYKDKPLWQAIQSESQDHYLDHVEALQNWIEQTNT